MLFSSPDYPVFLAAVFLLYLLAKLGRGPSVVARLLITVLLGDLVFLLLAKDPRALCDPLGGYLYGSIAAHVHPTSDGGFWVWSGNGGASLLLRFACGTAALCGGLYVGCRHVAWIVSERGQAMIARGCVALVVVGGAAVFSLRETGGLAALTTALAHYGHAGMLALVGLGFGAGLTEAGRTFSRLVVLFIVSSLFYQAWAIEMPGAYRYMLLLLFGTIVLDYYLALAIDRCEVPAQRKLLLIVSLVSNLGVLGIFKYADFFSQDVLHLGVAPLHLILPVGISFHTFQSLSYTIDVYRKELPATRSVVEFATFVLFFPQLVAGPIVRADDLLPQLQRLPSFDVARAQDGLFRILTGLFKKIALADTLAIAIVDRVFEDPSRFSSVEVAIGVVGYALQIYLDFSAYSDIAIGSAQLLGFHLPENFRTPYRSANLQEFWRRWHLSLSSWLRDYLYIALGGNRGGELATYRNLIMTMVLGGLWHGASWTFIVWGLLHGGGLAVTRLFQRRATEAPWRWVGIFGALLGVGAVVHRWLLPELGPWADLALVWIYATPLWAVATAWLSAPGPKAAPAPAPIILTTPSVVWAARLLRLAMIVTTALALWACLEEPLTVHASGRVWELAPACTWGRGCWVPLAILTWAFAIAAEVVLAIDRLRWTGGGLAVLRAAQRTVRRVLAGLMVFGYVCVAWVFFRAESFAKALAVLRRIGALWGDVEHEVDHSNLVPIVTMAITVAVLAHLFPDGTFRWLKERFLALPPVAKGALLAASALVLRELANPHYVPFIYFQF